MRRMLRICLSLCAGLALGLLPLPVSVRLCGAGILLLLGLVLRPSGEKCQTTESAE